MGKMITILPNANKFLTHLILQLNHKFLSTFPINISDLPAGTGQDGSQERGFFLCGCHFYFCI